MPPRRRKRPSEVQAEFCRAISAGLPLNLACKCVGIATATYHEWVARGEGRHGRRKTKEHADFAEAVKATEAAYLISSMALILKAGQDPARWQARAWALERKYPNEFARPAPRQEVAVTGELNTRVSLDDTAKSAAEKLARILSQRAATTGDDEDTGDAEPG